MKVKVFISVFVALLMIGVNTSFVNAESMVYSSTEKIDNAVATTYFKGNSQYENLSPMKKVIKIQDEQGVCVTKITLKWNSDSNNWIPAEKLDYVYNNDVLTSVSFSEWNNRKMAWVNSENMQYKYDMDGNLLDVTK